MFSAAVLSSVCSSPDFLSASPLAAVLSSSALTSPFPLVFSASPLTLFSSLLSRLSLDLSFLGERDLLFLSLSSRRLLGLLDRLLRLFSDSLRSAFNVSAIVFSVSLSVSANLACSSSLAWISAFLAAMKASGTPISFSIAESRCSHRAAMNRRAFLPFRKPVRLICISFGSGN